MKRPRENPRIVPEKQFRLFLGPWCLNFTENGGLLDFLFWSSLPKRVQLFFGKYKLRIEATSQKDIKTGKVSREFFTLRAFVSHYWNTLFSPFKYWRRQYFENPQLNWMLNPERGAIAIDTTSNVARFDNSTSSTLSHTCTGDDLVLVAITTTKREDGNSTGFTVSATYAAVPMTQASIGQRGSGAAQTGATFYKLSPATGANNIVATFSVAQDGKIGGISFTGADTTSIGNNGSNEAGTANSSIAVTTTPNSFVVDGICTENNLTVGADQTSVYIDTTDERTGMSYEQATGSTTTMSWTHATGHTGHAAVEVKEAISDLSINTNDSISVSENITAQNENLGGINVNETVTVTESITAQNENLGGINVDDSITVSENVNVASVLNLSVSDSVVVSESISSQIPDLGGISVNDTITITESVTGSLPERNFVLMRSNEQSRPLPLDKQEYPQKMRGKGQDRPLGMDDKRVL